MDQIAERSETRNGRGKFDVDEPRLSNPATEKIDRANDPALPFGGEDAHRW